MASRYTPQELQSLFERMAGPGLWIPQRREPRPYIGPVFAVYLRYSDLSPECADVGDQYWHLLQEVPVVNGIGVLATISNILAVTGRDREAHQVLHQRFLNPDLAERVAQNSPKAPALGVVFNRLGNIVAMRDLLLYGANRASETDLPITQIGALALCSNDFVERDPPFTTTPTNLELAAQVIRTWDVYNPRELAYAMTRAHTILTTILPSECSSITRLRNRIGMNSLSVDGLTLPEFVAMTFALFAYGNVVEREGVSRAVISPEGFFREFPKAQPLLNQFITGRALTVEQLTERLAGSAPRTQEQFSLDLGGKVALQAGLSAFRQQPLLLLSDGRVIILDLQFLTDLVTTGVYWLLFDSLPRERRDSFRELWGLCFERYIIDLLREFYPTASQFLSIEVPYSGGAMDAVLDFGPDVFIFEIKSSLLTEPAKRSGDAPKLAADVERKFVRNERGDPKGVVQLARAAEVIASGQKRTTITPTRIYPILITDEPGCECFAFNAYLNELFQKELGAGFLSIRPLTIMSVNECEELLPYTAANDFSWADLCETRFDNQEVKVWSVHQAIYDLRHARNLGVRRNAFILERFEEIFQSMLQTYGVERPDAVRPKSGS